VGGRVTRVTVIETGADLPPAFWSGFPTVEQIFERIRSSAADDYVKDVVAEFDAALGFPSLVSVTAKANVADGDYAYYARNAAPR
jgi:hypothetical protein